MAVSRVLFIDAYDSFANNIVSLLETTLPVKVVKIQIDDPLPVAELGSFSGVVVGPGPGSPYISEDVGCIRDLWTLADKDVLPVFGICLGFQSLVSEFGGKVQQLPYPRHGFTTEITTSGNSIFQGISKFDAVQYHSLYGTLGHEDWDDTNIWTPSKSSPDLIPIAWDQDHLFSTQPPTVGDLRASDGHFNPRMILMGVKHVSKPFFGVQFHPESVKSSAGARQTVINWWKLAEEWNERNRPNRVKSSPVVSTEDSEHDALCHLVTKDKTVAMSRRSVILSSRKPVYSKSFDVATTSVPFIRETLSNKYGLGEEIIILDSEMNQLENLGKHSIIGLIFPDTLKISYSVSSGHVTLRRGSESTSIDLREYEDGIGKFIKAFMQVKRISHQSVGSPFIGGLMGYVDYEACLETIGVPAPPNEARPNIAFAFIERSVVINHEMKQVFVQSIHRDDEHWVEEATDALTNPNSNSASHSEAGSSLQSSNASPCLTPATGSSPDSFIGEDTSADPITSKSPTITTPQDSLYCSKVRDCHAEIRKGNSYELCLTGTTEIKTAPSLPAWFRYLRLRSANPATFGAYLRLGPLTLLSSSPERFMWWSRPEGEGQSVCQFRPIKGTVRKHQTNPDGSPKFIDLETATALLAVPKEQAENLMIADLIRHDLTGIAGSGSVHCHALMSVEEYYSVYQLVTVIEGILKADPATGAPIKSGVDVLGASLPPGSMTGAPKKRSCALLRGIEDQRPRSVYSGVLGYMDVAGGGDFSVVIRTAYRWDDEVGAEQETWRIGAGGAVTDMSEPMAEFEEMRTKLEPVLGIFT